MNRFNIDEFTPDQPEDIPTPPVAELDKAAKRRGFVSREPIARKRRRTIDEPSDQINIRASIADINRFVEWCEANRYSNREGFHELVQLIGRKR